MICPAYDAAFFLQHLVAINSQCRQRGKLQLRPKNPDCSTISKSMVGNFFVQPSKKTVSLVWLKPISQSIHLLAKCNWFQWKQRNPQLSYLVNSSGWIIFFTWHVDRFQAPRWWQQPIQLKHCWTARQTIPIKKEHHFPGSGKTWIMMMMIIIITSDKQFFKMFQTLE